MNWNDRERSDKVQVECVSPSSYGHLGWLTVTEVTITEDYYSDTRINATVKTINPEQYVPLSMLRIYHEATFSDGSKQKWTLGTFFVTSASSERKSGRNEITYECHSVLWGMSEDLAPNPMTLAKGGTASSAFTSVCNTCKRKYVQVAGYVNKKWTAALTLEAGNSYLSWLHQIADNSGNRIDCDELGRVTIAKYTAPHNRSHSMSIQYNSPLILADGIKRDSDEFTVASRSIVTWNHTYTSKKKSETKPVTSYVDVSSGSPSSIGRRGFRISKVHQYDDLGTSQATAQTKAKSHLNEDSSAITTWSINCRWFIVHEGDIFNWKPSYPEAWRKVVVQSADKDMKTMTIALKLREV